jgi:Ser/Thr protein kinase RdoA (MazF antagonist)
MRVPENPVLLLLGGVLVFDFGDCRDGPLAHDGSVTGTHQDYNANSNSLALEAKSF